MKRQLIRDIYEADGIGATLVLHLIVYGVISFLSFEAHGSHGTFNSHNVKTVFTIEIVIYLLIESFIFLTNSEKERRKSNLEKNISDIQNEIRTMEDDLQNLQNHLNSIPNTDSIPYTDSMASYTIVGENYY